MLLKRVGGVTSTSYKNKIKKLFLVISVFSRLYYIFQLVHMLWLVNLENYYKTASHKDWEQTSSWIWLVKTGIESSLDFPM